MIGGVMSESKLGNLISSLYRELRKTQADAQKAALETVRLINQIVAHDDKGQEHQPT